MPLRFPLLARILLWFFLNLVVLGVIGYAGFRMQFRLGLDSLLAGRSGERVQALSEVIGAELKDKPARAWGDSLTNFGNAYQADFLLFRMDGTQVAGTPTTLPPEVRAKLTEYRGPGEGLGRGPPPGRGPRRELDNARALLMPKFFVHAGVPARYWVGTGLPLTEGGQTRGRPLVLLAASDSMGLGGLLFDTTPWLVVGLGALLVSVLLWIPLVRNLTRSISQITRATQQIAEGQFEARVSERRSDELGHLGQAINRMAARLAGLVSGQKRFLGDIAHELCSPLARMQVALSILEDRGDSQQKAYVADVREEVEEMSGLVNELLSFSKASLRQKNLPLEAVPLAPLAQEVIARQVPEDCRVELAVPDSLQVQADPELLRRALANVLRNAVRYAGQAGPIRVSASARDGSVIVTISDRGPGVAEEALPQIFDPFFRGEASRSRDSGGAGLGLAIVKTCLEACQGRVSARNQAPSGLCVELVLQAAPASANAKAG
jgi:two-component system sensor histidine kinase CpxA